MPPPANEIRSGALARIRGRVIGLPVPSARSAASQGNAAGNVHSGWLDRRNAIPGVVPRGYRGGYLVY